MTALEEQLTMERASQEAPLTFHLQTVSLPPASRALVHAAVRIVSDNIADDDLVYFFQLALFEACANVCCHAYAPDGPGPLELTLRLHPCKRLEAEVRDWGQGFASRPVKIVNPPADAIAGRGLFIISQAADTYTIDHLPDGVRVRITMNLREDQWIPFE